MLNKNNFFLGYSEETNEISNKKGNNKLINFLTNEAMTLLNEATNDVNGQILNLSFIGGESIQTNGMEFIQDNNPKGKALWVSALKELEEKFLIKPTSSNKNIFEVTNLGYKSIEQTA
jgi:hypothetical protein